MSDSISRQSAIDAVHKDYDDILDFTSDGATIASSVEDIIRALPSVQPEQRWIPCSERLPDKDDWVAITIKHKTEYDPEFDECKQEEFISVTFYNVGVGYYFLNRWNGYEDNFCLSGEVVAWMPLPEPYEGRWLE